MCVREIENGRSKEMDKSVIRLQSLNRCLETKWRNYRHISCLTKKSRPLPQLPKHGPNDETNPWGLDAALELQRRYLSMIFPWQQIALKDAGYLCKFSKF